MSSFTNDARRTGIDKRRKGIGNNGCYRCCDPDDFLAMVHASKTNQEAADNLFVLLNMLPPHAQVWMLYSLIHEQSAVSDVQLLTIYSKAISTLSDSSEQVAHIKIKQHWKTV